MVKVSVIMPIYNGENTLSNTLDSLLAQTFKDFEIVACIDGTLDNSESILKKYSNKFKDLTILKNVINRGLGPTMNKLLSHAKGDFVAIAEQDDYYYPDRLQLQVEVLSNDKTIGLVSGIAEFWDGNRVVGKFPGILVHGNQYPKGIDMFILNYRYHLKVANSCIMFRKSVHIDNGLYFTQHYPSISVDWTYILRFCLVSNIYGLNQVLVKLDRRINRNSVTSNKTQQFLATRELIRSFAYEYPKIISKNDFKFAMRTQYVMEINSKSGVAYVLSWAKHFAIYPLEKRYLESIKKRIMLKIKIYFK